MSSAYEASAYIHEGVWTNWSKGRIWGSTLTLSPQHAAILSPAIAIIISLAGAQLWRLFQFALHQSRATSEEKDFLYHQQQVTLRNTSTDLNTLWRLLRIGFAWRHQARTRSMRRTWILALWTVFHLVLVVLASLFSSTFLEAGNAVLTRSSWCGSFNNSYVANLQNNALANAAFLQNQYFNYQNSRYNAVLQYVNTCTGTREGCNVLFQDSLPWNATVQNESCPFKNSSVCHTGGYGSIAFDTGYLSSHSHLGLNTPVAERVSLRMTAQCAPLNDEQYITKWKPIAATADSPALQAVDAHYGVNPWSERNATYSFSDYQNYMQCDDRATSPSYTLKTVIAQADGNVTEGTSTFTPIPELVVENADTTLVFLMFDNAYSTPITDPWFSATTAVNDTNAFCDGNIQEMYERDLPLTTLGCTQQVQVCQGDEDDRKCGDPMGVYQLLEFSKTSLPGWSDRQATVLARVANAVSSADMFWIVNSLSLTDIPLLANSQISQTMSLPLPDGQWQLETKYWQTLALAYLQQGIVDFSTGQFAAETSYINQSMLHGDSADRWLCENQMIRSHSYRSFNFCALILILVLCFLCILAGLTIEDIISLIRQRQLRYTIGKQDMWIVNSDLEMLRVLSELQTGAKWTRSKNGIPLAEPGHTVSVSQLRPELARAQYNTSLSELHLPRANTVAPTLASTPKIARHTTKYSFEPVTTEFSPASENSSPPGSASSDVKHPTKDKWHGMDITETAPQDLSYRNNFATTQTLNESSQYMSSSNPVLREQTRLPDNWGVLPAGASHTKGSMSNGKRRLSSIFGSTWGGRLSNTHVQ